MHLVQVKKRVAPSRQNVSFMQESNLKSGFACRRCGEWHDVLPMSYSVKAPLAATRIAEEELEQRVVLTADQCVIDGRRFYLRGRILVPVMGIVEPFIWGVWAEVNARNFLRTTEMWTVAGREKEAPFPGWLDTNLLPFGSTLQLPITVQTQVVGRRPHFTVVDPKHPLAIEQRVGISLERVEQLAELVMHGGEQVRFIGAR